MNSRLKGIFRSVHDGVGDLFPSMKTDAVRRINRHPALSNALRRAAGLDELDDTLKEEPIGIFKAASQDTKRLARGILVKGARNLVNEPWMRQRVLPVLDRTPRLRAYLKRTIFPNPPVEKETFAVDDVRSLTHRGLMIYGMLTALQQRGED